MRSSKISFLPFVAQAAFVACAPTASSEPCAQVSAALVDKSSPTNAGGFVAIDPDTALACVQSVPVDKTGDILQLQGLQTVWNFQSDVAFQKDPTPGWLYPGVDLIASVGEILEKVQSDSYDNEYDVQLDLYNLAASGYDFHLIYRPDITQVFSWNRQLSLVSVSTTPGALPDIYAFSDIPFLSGLNQSDYTPSPITQINGTDVETFLNRFATINPYDHDPDTNYNGVLQNIPNLAGLNVQAQWAGSGNAFSTGLTQFPGSVTTVSFANGSTASFQNYATVANSLDFTGVTDGVSFFKKFCSGSPSAPSGGSSSIIPVLSSSAAPTSAPSGSVTLSTSSAAALTTNNLYTPLASAEAKIQLQYYPEPFDAASDISIAGYFPEAEKDLLVISIPTFSPVNDYEFQNTLRSALATAKSLGKTKLLIDLRGNGGGTVVDGYSFFTELFPSMQPLGLGNLHAWPLLDDMGQVASTYTDDQISALNALQTLDVAADLTVTDQDYDSWADFYGPVQHHGGNFTNARRYNFSSPLLAPGNPIYGFGSDDKPQPQTFESDNIVILSDGFCGSTCALFSELMKTQGGVKSIAVGGRKQNCAMQPVGGSKGSNDQGLSDIGQVLLTLVNNGTAEQQALFKPYLEAGLKESYSQLVNRLAYWNPGANVNFLNNLRKDDSSATPLMFVYEAANCRFFYTPEMIVDQSLVWSAAYNLQWGNGTCVPGSTNQPSSQTGFSTSYINSPPPTCASNFFGADLSWWYVGYGAGVSSSSSNSSSPSSTSSSSPSSSSYSTAPATGSAASSSALTAGACLLIAFVCGLLV